MTNEQNNNKKSENVLYYIVENDQQHLGPFDLISLVKKIKTGRISESTMITLDGRNDVRPASAIETLQHFFMEDENESDEIALASHEYDLKNISIEAIEYLKSNLSALAFSGLLLTGSIAAVILFKDMFVLNYVGSFSAIYLMYSIYMLTQLKSSRGQAYTASDILSKFSSQFASLAIASVVLSVLFGIGSILLIAPGLLVLTFYAFVPLLIQDKNLGFWEAMETSRKTVMSMGSNNIGVLLSLQVANFLAAVCMLFPLIFTLPLTNHALCEMYDDLYNRS